MFPIYSVICGISVICEMPQITDQLSSNDVLFFLNHLNLILLMISTECNHFTQHLVVLLT